MDALKRIFLIGLLWMGSASAWIELQGSLGYRYDQFSWTIAGRDVNVLSELKWTDLSSVEARGQLEAVSRNGLLFQLDVAGGYIWDGRNRDLDWNQNNRQGEYSRSYSDTEGATFDASIALGRYIPCGLYWAWILKGGLATRALYLADHNLEEREVIRHHGFHSEYASVWLAPFLGVEVRRYCANIEFRFEFEGYTGVYGGVGDWHLRDDMDEFRHYAPAYGVRGSVEAIRHLGRFGIFLGFIGQYWWTDRGRMETDRSDGSHGRQPFRGAKWTSLSANLGIRYCY